MVFGEDKLREHLNRHLSFVRREIDVHKVVLYGSYTYGAPHDDSDIDLVILSNDFAQMPRLERYQWRGEFSRPSWPFVPIVFRVV